MRTARHTKAWLVAVLCLLFSSFFALFIFAQARVPINKEVAIPFDVDSSKTYLILYFGYVGCPDICPYSLNKISELSDLVSSEDVEICFVNLTPVSSNLVRSYSKLFGQKINGVQIEGRNKNKLLEDLAVFHSPTRMALNKFEAHSSKVYFFRKQKESSKWNLQYVYSNGSNNIAGLFKYWKQLKATS